MLALDKRRAEEDEGIRWAGDVARAFPAARLRCVGGSAGFFGREDVSGGRLKGRRRVVSVARGSHVGRELDHLRWIFDGRGPLEIELGLEVGLLECCGESDLMATRRQTLRTITTFLTICRHCWVGIAEERGGKGGVVEPLRERQRETAVINSLHL